MKVRRQDVLDTALALLDEVGLDGLTMRRLAQALGIQAPSLYWHFPNKQALLDAMADAMLNGVDLPDTDVLPWEEWLLRMAIEFRNRLKARRDGARVFAGTFLVTDNVLRFGERAIGRLRAAGADERTAVRALFTLQYFILGFTIEEQAATPAVAGVDLPQLTTQVTTEQTARYPNGASVVALLAEDDDEERFLFGLTLLIDGLKGVIPAR
jgi:TetR/AcrR family transcriptional regulator, tetracycline repressor protein